MRGLPARRLASSALSAALVLGIAAPVAIAADHDSAPSRTSTPVPGADELLSQIDYLAGLDTAFTPITDLLDTVLAAEGGQLTESQASALEVSVQEAIEEVMAGMPVMTPSAATPSPSAALPSAPAAPATPGAQATPAAPSAPAAPSVPAAPSTPAVPSAPATPATPTTPATNLPATSVPATTLPAPVDDDIDMPSADVTEDAISELEKLIDELLDAATSGAVNEVLPAATDVITGLLDILTETLVAAGLPAPSLPAEPAVS
ncbi:hypothetical protein [Streptomyces sp. NPDC059861]|uniref:hypothetical protein n=1 Tax=Streptomyces sp. NPDC059861 TaxID=3346974 RepID=UPI003663C63A